MRLAFPIHIALIVFACLTGRLQADPVNFVVSELTFTRPDSWEWLLPESQSRKAHLKIWSEKKNQWADVMFYVYEPGDDYGKPESCLKRWKAQFQERDQIKPKIETVASSKATITFAFMEGTYKIGKPVTLLDDYALFGAIIQTSQGNVMIRMTGPSFLVHKALTDFKQMVGAAVVEPS